MLNRLIVLRNRRIIWLNRNGIFRTIQNRTVKLIDVVFQHAGNIPLRTPDASGFFICIIAHVVFAFIQHTRSLIFTNSLLPVQEINVKDIQIKSNFFEVTVY